MENSIIFPPSERTVYTTMHQEPNNDTPPAKPNIHTPSTSSTAVNSSVSSKSFKPAQQTVFIPPGHVGFRLLCHPSRVGGLIGKSGSIVKKLQELTNSIIRVDYPENSPHHRVVTVIGLPHIVKRIKLSAAAPKIVLEEGDSNGGEEEGLEVSAAQEGVVRVFERVVDVAAEGDAAAAIGGMVSCRLVVGKKQGGVVIGKEGEVVQRIRKDTGCKITVFASEKLSSGSLPAGEIVEIEGDVLGVKKALVAVTSRLQEFSFIEKTKAYGTKPFEAESLPVPKVDLPIQRSPQLHPLPSNSINGAPGGNFFQLDSSKVSNSDLRPQQQEVVFIVLCPNECVGSIIGKGGTIVRALQNETGASVSVGPTVAECNERLITITADENIESQYSPAQNAAVLVFNKYMKAGDVTGLDSFSKGSPIYARVVVPENHVGCLMGKRGAIISEMRKATGTGLRILGRDQVPKCCPENVEVLQITGEFVNVQDAFYKVTRRLRDNIFSTKMSAGSGYHNSSRTYNSTNGRVRCPPVGGHPSPSALDNLNEQRSLINSMGSLGISNGAVLSQSMSSLVPSTMNQGNNVDDGRRLPPVKGGVELGSGSRSAIVTNTTVKIAVPDNVIGSIYGGNGNNLARLRQISGAKVTVHEPDPGTTDRIVVISGTPHQTQAAQSLLQAFILAGS